MKLVNLTRRPLALYDVEGRLIELPPDPRHVGVVGITEQHRLTGADGRTFALTESTLTGLKGMPDPEPDTLYLVPFEVALVLQGRRDDVVLPADETLVPGPDGRPVAVTRLRRLTVRPAGGR